MSLRAQQRNLAPKRCSGHRGCFDRGNRFVECRLYFPLAAVTPVAAAAPNR
jgi:hypothetical protein